MLVSAPVMVRFEAVGRWYESRVRHMTGDSHGSVESSSDEEPDEGLGNHGEDDTAPGGINPLLLDPTQWKVGILVILSGSS